jgi:hypothetical protein
MNEIDKMISMLSKDYLRLKKAGCKLAMAALRVNREYDGMHRLSLAVADFMQAIADEGDRYKYFGNIDKEGN